MRKYSWLTCSKISSFCFLLPEPFEFLFVGCINDRKWFHFSDLGKDLVFFIRKCRLLKCTKGKLYSFSHGQAVGKVSHPVRKITDWLQYCPLKKEKQCFFFLSLPRIWLRRAVPDGLSKTKILFIRPFHRLFFSKGQIHKSRYIWECTFASSHTDQVRAAQIMVSISEVPFFCSPTRTTNLPESSSTRFPTAV